MKGFRSQRLQQDGPPAWTDLRAFDRVGWRPKDSVVLPDALSPIIRGVSGVPDTRGLFMTTEADMFDHLDHVFGWAREKLALEDSEGWWTGIKAAPQNSPPGFSSDESGRSAKAPKRRPKTPAYLKQLISHFYRKRTNAIAWVVVESCRDLIRLRHANYVESLQKNRQPIFGLSANLIEDRAVLPLHNGVKLSTNDLRFVTPKEFEYKETRFARMYVERQIIAGGRTLTGNWTTWCAASEEDGTLSAGSAPASRRYVHENGFNPARLMTWLRLDTRSGLTESYAFDLHGDTGMVFSIRYAVATLQMHIELDPWLDDWLLTALRRY